jgi:hypothetical protein
MRRTTAALLAASTLAACASNSGVPTTPTYAPARYIPPAPASARPQAALPQTARRGTALSGAAAVRQATIAAMVEPDDASMRGATWVIDDVQPYLIYRVPLKPRFSTMILLPPGEQFRGAVGGDVEKFNVTLNYGGNRPVFSVSPKGPQASGNIQIMTTGGAYSFQPYVTRHTALNAVDIKRARPAPLAALTGTPQPEGDYTPLALVPEGGRTPPWLAGTQAYADSYKMVIAFPNPLPTLPALFAGQRGEQTVSYRKVEDGGVTFLVTNRRVTYGALKLGSEVAHITIDLDAVKAGTAPDPAKGGEAWKAAEALPGQAPDGNVAVVVVPATPSPSEPVSVFGLPQSFPPVTASLPSAPPPAAKAPAADEPPSWM